MNCIKIFNNHNSIIHKIPKNTDILLLGESTYGTEEFYDIRANITKQLITYEDYNIILMETDWYNLYIINKYIQDNSDFTHINDVLTKINNFPNWLLKNNIFIELIKWLKDYNKCAIKKIYLLGIDCYLLIETLQLLYTFLKVFDLKLYKILKKDLHFLNRYKKTTDFIHYFINKSNNNFIKEEYFHELLLTIQKNKNTYKNICIKKSINPIAIINIEICCDVIINSYEFIKKQFSNEKKTYGNIRDQHMLMTIIKLKDNIKNSKIIIWGHNSHIGDATSTENGGTNLSNNNTWNLGQMCRSMFQNTYIIGFGTYNGSVIASYKWGVKEQIFILNFPLKDSIEEHIYLFCQKRNINNCYIDLHFCKNIPPFNQKKPQRTIGLTYNSINEIEHHYISSILSKQFDLYIFISYTTHLIEQKKEKSLKFIH